MTDAVGIAEITTIYPGCHQGRTVHIHAKVHLSNAEALTTQLYFDDRVTDAVHQAPPCSTQSIRRTPHEDDAIHRSGPTLSIVRDGDGHLGLVTLGVDA